MRVWKMHAFTEVWDNKKKIDIGNLKKKKYLECLYIGHQEK